MKIPNGNKMYQMVIKHTKGPLNIPNGIKVERMEVKETKWT
jgi:hypothetical protein